MKLTQLFPELTTADLEIGGMTMDSRRVQAGDLFFAVPGLQQDGRDYITQAVAAGAAAVAYEPADYQLTALPVPAIAVPGLQQQLSKLAGVFYGQPSQQLSAIGVTGTNGKTSVSLMLAQALTAAQKPCGVIGTLGSGMLGQLTEHGMTTPDPLLVQAQLARLHAQGASHVAMEVSSHALDQGRVEGVSYAVAIFTNLSRDHLDYHGDMSAYGAAKALLFKRPLLAAVINIDDEFGRQLAAESVAPVISYSLEDTRASVYCSDTAYDSKGVRTTLHGQGETFQLRSALLGSFNLSNLLAVIASLSALKVPLSQAVELAAELQPPAGRMQRLGGGAAPLVVIDYAHTPDALDKALAALHEHASGRVVCVFGCGGDRDKGKRALMAQVAEQRADAIVVTSDNPRSEPPQQIIEQICQGMERSGLATVIPNRAAAIAETISAAGVGDVILLAGKGHETYQEIEGVRHPFSDIEHARQALLQWEATHA
tara:strand:+ start:3852 stop:5303 length:1452 start_codon:yes stop_codon:yes gene_type:complete